MSDTVSDTIDGSEEEEEEEEEVYYSQDATVQAIRDYYTFLCTMYLDPDRVAEPPEEGWPEITTERFKHMHKSEQVIGLLRRHLPYITTTNDDNDVAYGSAHCKFADWATEARLRRFPEQSDEKEGDDWRVGSEVYDYKNVPDTVIGLTLGGRGNDTLLLDTEMGMIHWIECPEELKWGWKLYPDGRMEP
jgi:hypothetical protein